MLAEFPAFKKGIQLMSKIRDHLPDHKGGANKRTDWDCPLCGYVLPGGYAKALAGDRVVHCPKCDLRIDV